MSFSMINAIEYEDSSVIFACENDSRIETFYYVKDVIGTSEANMLALNEHAIDIIWIRHRETLSNVTLFEGGFLRASRLISVKS
ncbi:hypothetical protein ACNO7L_08145 [Bisgaard Taxon 45]